MHNTINQLSMIFSHTLANALVGCTLLFASVLPYRLFMTKFFDLAGVVIDKESTSFDDPTIMIESSRHLRRRRLGDAATTQKFVHTHHQAPRIWTQLTFGLEYDMDLLPHTIQHYLNAGLDPHYFMISLHQTEHDDNLANSVQTQLKDEYGIFHIQTWHGNFTSQESWEHKVQQRKDAGVRDCDWIVKADADELVRVPDIPALLQTLSDRNYDVVYGTMVDRVAWDGSLPPINNQSSLQEQFPWQCKVTEAGHANTTKAIAFRGYLTEFRAGHGLLYGQQSCPFPHRLAIDHYKWTQSVVDKLERRQQHYQWLEQQGRGFHWWRESSRFLRHLESHHQRIDIDNDEFECQLAAENEDDIATMMVELPQYPLHNSMCGASSL